MGISIVLVALLLAGAPARPDFTGSWAFDKDRSFSNPAGMDQTMQVQHTGERVSIDAQLVTSQGRQNVQEEWTLDGVEREFTPAAPPDAKGKRKAYWLPMDRGLVVEDTVTVQTPTGPAQYLTTRRWTLSADAQTLTVDYYIDRPTISGESRRTFKRIGVGPR
jgi:hypothetical protein